MKNILITVASLFIFSIILNSQNGSKNSFSCYISYDVNLKENAKKNTYEDYQKHTFNLPDKSQKKRILAFFTDYIVSQKDLKSYTGSIENPPANLGQINYEDLELIMETSNNEKHFIYDTPNKLSFKKGIIYSDKEPVYDTNKDLIDSIFSICFFEKWSIDPVNGSFTKTIKDIGLKLKNEDIKTLFRLKAGTFNKPFYQKIGNDTYCYENEYLLLDNIVYDVSFTFNSKTKETHKNPSAEVSDYYHYIPQIKRKDFVASLLNCTKSENCNIYKNSTDISTQLSDSTIIEQFVEKQEIYVEEYEMAPIQVEDYIYMDEIGSVRFYESWYYDPENLSIKKIVNGISLLRHTGDVEMYWPVKEPFLYIQFKNNIQTQEGKTLKNVLENIGNHIKIDENLNLVYDHGKYFFMHNDAKRTNDKEYDIVSHNLNSELIKIQNITQISENTEGYYDEIGNYIPAEQLRLEGLIDKNGHEIIPCIYDKIEMLDNKHFIIHQNDYIGLLKPDGSMLIPPDFSWIDPEFEHKKIIKVFTRKISYSGKYGFYDKTGKEIYSPKYLVENITDSLIALKTDSQTLIIDHSGKQIHACDKIFPFYESNVSVIVKNGLYGYIDRVGNEIIKPQYLFAHPYSNGRAKVYLSNDCHYIDESGKRIDDAPYDKIRKQNDNLYIIGIGNHWDNILYGLADSTGNEIIPLKYKQIDKFKHGVALVKDQNYKSGIINTSGEEILKCLYKDIRNFSNEAYIIYENRKHYGVSDTGAILFYDIIEKKLIKTEYQGIGELYKNITYVVKDNKYGFINGQLEEINMGRYDWMPLGYRSNLGYGYRIVYKGETDEKFSKGKFGAIDSTGKEVIPCKYNWIYDFANKSLTRVYIGKILAEGVPLEGKFNLVDNKGNELINWEYDFIYEFNDGLARVYKGNMTEEGYPDGGKFGFIDETGKVIIPLIYDAADNAYYDQIQVMKNGETYYIDYQGTRIN